MTGINGWKCRPRDCTYCSHGIHGFPCGGGTCSQCEFGIHGWRCQVAATQTVCLVAWNSAPAPFNSSWQGFARYEVTQQNDRAWAKLFFSSNLQVAEVTIRTGASETAWQVYPQTLNQVGVSINWGRLPPGTMYSYDSFAASTAAFSPSNGRTAPAYVIPTATVPIFLWVAPVVAGGSAPLPAPSAATNQFQCTTTTGFQADAVNARASGANFKRSLGTEEWQEATRHAFAIQG